MLLQAVFYAMLIDHDHDDDFQDHWRFKMFIDHDDHDDDFQDH